MSKRIQSIDIVRGLVMIIMALDHLRDLLHAQSLASSPTNLATTTAPLFFSRWMTHLCAPTFVFLSGVSVYLSSKRKNISAARIFLLKRGLWLIVLEFTIVNFLLWFDVQFRILMLQVIAAIGIGFIVMAMLLTVSPKLIGIIGLVILFTHNLLQFVPPSQNVVEGFLRNLLFTPGVQALSPQFMFFISYPLVPWVAIMMVGFSFGRIYEKEESQRNIILLRAGVGALILFVALRLLNIYGDQAPWSQQKTGFFTFLSFLNVSKYPPSLLFTLLFLGITGILLRYANKFPRGIKKVLSVYGSVPLFYYLLHWILVRVSVFIMLFAQGFTWKDMQFEPFRFGRPAGQSGIGLAGVLLVWVAVVVVLYPLCNWYSNYRKNHPEKEWLRYL